MSLQRAKDYDYLQYLTVWKVALNFANILTT